MSLLNWLEIKAKPGIGYKSTRKYRQGMDGCETMTRILKK